MTPIKFTVKDGITHFHYNYSELREFVRLGKSHGNVGNILVRRKGDLITYKGFGTNETPLYDMITITSRHLAILDGEMPTDEERLIPPVSPFVNHTIIFLGDISDFESCSDY